MFWNTNTLKDRLPELISDFDERRVERANYTLRIGREVYISPTNESHNTQDHTKIQLEDNQGFSIPPGQFGFLMTQEEIKVPKDAIAFISIRANYKFRGLIDVSGFHIDPGYTGKLIFAVFNAGPSRIHLSQGDQCFHIWFAGLDNGEDDIPPKVGYETLDSNLIQNLSDEVLSLKSLSDSILSSENRLKERMVTIEGTQNRLNILVTVVIALLSAFLVTAFGSIFESFRKIFE